MEKLNLTVLNYFILMGITDRPELQTPLFVLFLFMYMTSLMANLGLVILTRMDAKLQTPLYFFLRHLALMDFGCSTTVSPKMLVNFVVGQNKISFCLCALQLSLFSFFIANEFFILSAMSYDRYVAICNPLLYAAIMSPRLCQVLTAIPYIYSTVVSLTITFEIFNQPFCGGNVIRHFYCDSVPLISLFCSGRREIEMIIMIFGSFNLLCSVPIVLVSYLFISVAILRMKSAEGRRKAFSTCGSHLTVVTLFYGTLIFMYLKPNSSHSLETDKVTSIFYTLIIPVLNPLIYSLRNKDVKHALQRMWKKLWNVFSKICCTKCISE
ncbi:olfactory receptor 8K3-like [Erinaceus europaeus]|uniref:Olfactory receptor 8K3-like n=1 Tax=Erinaceus europaeus TaxID=9365 RepID=A0A1S2ZHU2_ERIEU|nr:olfactory receptor 8K3-like [Erinaceus europaeus]